MKMFHPKALLKKYQNLNRAVKASFWFLVCSFFQKGVAFITTPIFTRLFTADQYGIYSVSQSWSSVISLLVGLKLSAEVYVQGLIKYEDDRDRYTSSLLGLSLTSSAVWTVVYLLFRPAFERVIGLSPLLIGAMFAIVPLADIYGFWASRKRVTLSYRSLLLLTVINVTVSPIVGILAVAYAPDNFKVEARVLSLLAVDLVMFLGIGINIFKQGRVFYDKKYWKHALKFNIPLLPHFLSLIVLNQSDRIMIKSFFNAAAAGIYSVAYSLSYTLNILNQAIASTLNPWIFKCLKDKNTKNIARISYCLLILIAACNFALIAVAPELISLLAPPTYRAAVWVVLPVTASNYFMFMYNLFATFQYYYEKTAFVSAGSLLNAGLNVLLNFIFLMLFKGQPNGFIAAGYTTLFCYICYALAHYLFMRHINRTQMDGCKIYSGKIIVLISVFFLGISALITLLYPYPLIRWGVIVAGLLTLLLLRRRVSELFRQLKQK